MTASSNRKKPLSHEHKVECDKLKKLFEENKKQLGISQKTLAIALGCNQSSVSHYLNGVNPLNANAAAIFAKELKITVNDFSPRLAKEITTIASALKPIQKATPINTVSLKIWDEDTPLHDDEVEVPFLEEIQLAAGVGYIAVNEDYQNAAKLRFGKNTLRKIGVYPRNIICVTVKGNSMSPIIPDNTTVGVDTAYTKITNGDIYALAIDDELLKIKQLYKLPNGNIRLHSFNTEEFVDEEYLPTAIRVIGRVFWYSVLL